MAAKYFVICCSIALSIQNIYGQCIGPYNGFADGLVRGPGFGWDAAQWAGPGCAGPWAAAPCAERGLGFGPAGLAASNGGGFAVTSASPIAPTGIAMTSENAYEGVLAVTGALPFLAAVSLEGVLPTAGAGAVTYSCGNGNVAILNEDVVAPAFAGPLGYRGEIAGPAFGYNGYPGPYGYEAGFPGPGYGFGYGGCGLGALY